MRQPRVFIGFVDIAGYFTDLAKGFDALGVSCDFVNLAVHRFRPEEGPAPVLIRWLRWLGARRIALPAHKRFQRLFWTGLQEAFKLPLFLAALVRYDAFIFAYNSRFLGFLDLPILKFFGKTIIYTYLGSDSRPPYLNGALILADPDPQPARYIQAARLTRRVLAIVERYADAIVDYPPQGHFHSRPFVKGLIVGFPKAIAPGLPVEPEPGRPVRILHSPSRGEGKGTPVIRQAIAALRAKGHAVEFVEVSGRPNVEVLAAIAECDFVVDQVYSDTPLAGFAAEAAFLGKPAVVGGYYAACIADDIPTDLIPPSLFCHPDDLEAAIERLITEPDFRRELGHRAQAFVTAHWSPAEVARRYLRLIAGDVPAEWLCDPAGIRYVHGALLPEAQGRAMIRDIVELGGPAALQVSDKPELERRLVAFAEGEELPC